jgi:hypothetical protein
MTVLDDIVKWSDESASAWVRDALRRIVTQNALSESDLDDLTNLCKKAHGLGGDEMTVVPLTAAHLPTAADEGCVALDSITHVSDVNALAPGATLTLAPIGLTVVYGDNGAGKTGYARILKQACRARGSGDPVLPNALSESPVGTPTARIKIVVDGNVTEHTWTDGTPCAAALGAVSVFDTSAAQVYITDRTEVRFRPYGLDVLDKLADACSKVKARLDKEKAALEARSVALPAVPTNTQVAKLLQNLTALTPESEVRRLGTLTATERQELDLLGDVLAVAKAEDPAKKAADLRLKTGRITRLVDGLKAINSLLNGQGVSRLVGLRQEAAQATAVAQNLAASLADSSRLPGLGEQAWRQLWASAEAYSTGHAYQSQAFPLVTEEALCVLCQQHLGDEARTRLAKFADFVRGQAQQEAQSKRRAVKTLEQQLEGYDLKTGFRDAREDLAGIDATLAHAIEPFFDAAAKCRDELLKNANSETPVDQVPPTEGLEHLAASLRLRADELEKASSFEQRKISETREADLRARRILADHLETVTDEIRRKATINAFVTCIADTDTRGLTRLSTELTKEYVTSILVGAFADEAKKLRFVTPEIELRAVGGQKGSLYHQVQLKHASRAALPKVVSEGEGRCIALAAFLAELRSAGRPSGIVFDDPVSSLDHRWRDKVAERLVEEARTRQVIVFTHELVFLFALQKAAETTAIPFHGQTLWRHANSAGHVEPDLPWNALSTQKRIGHLKQRWQQAEKVHRVDGPMQYGPIATDLYAKLRQAWERAIEEVLLCGVVERFRRGVETQRLKNIRDIEAGDVEAVTDGMTKCSRWEGGHDHALAANDPIPAPADLKKDIDALEEWVASINKRRSKK